MNQFDGDLANARNLNVQSLVAIFRDQSRRTESRAACFEVLTDSIVHGETTNELWKLVSSGLNDTAIPIQRCAIGVCHFFESSMTRDSLWNIVLSGNENRHLAIRELAKIGDSRVLHACLTEVATGDFDATLEAVISLSFLKDSAALPFLSDVLASCDDETLLAVTALAISRCGGDEQTESILARFATTGTLPERLPFVCELARIRSKVGLDELEHMLDDSSDLNKMAFRNALCTAALVDPKAPDFEASARIFIRESR